MVAQLKKFSISEILNQLLNVFFNRVNKSINSIVINQSYIIKETNAMTILFMNENSVSFVCIWDGLDMGEERSSLHIKMI